MEKKAIITFGGGLLLAAGLGLAAGLLVAKRQASRSALAPSGSALKTSDSLPTTATDPVNPDIKSALGVCYLKEGKENEPLFVLGKESFRLEDLPALDQAKLIRAMEESWVKQSQILEDLALRISLNDGSNKKIADLSDLTAEAARVDETEVKAFYANNSASFPKDSGFEKVKKTLEAHLKAQKTQRWLDENRAQLRQKGLYTNTAPMPCPPQMHLDLTNFPSLDDNPNSPISAVVVTGPFCQACRSLWPQLEMISRESKGKMSLRPVPFISRETEPADLLWAKAQFCAAKEGKGRTVAWLDVAHRVPITLQDDMVGLKEWILKTGVTEAQLIVADFTTCLESPEASGFADAALSLCRILGVDQAPIAYANGRRLLTQRDRGEDIRATFQALVLALPVD